jgi:enoyl-CoA hydratase/carnithine racemase
MAVGSIDLVAAAFDLFNVLRLASYFPQLVAVARDQNGATAISFSCWSIWIGANAATAAYAWLNLRDVPLAVVSAFNGICCGAVLTLALYKRAAARVRRSRSPSLAVRATGLIEGQQRRSEIEPKM